MTTTPTPVTAEDLLRMPETTGPLELVRGRVVASPWSGALHGLTVARFGTTLHQWSASDDEGAVGLRAGFILARDPDTVRAPDAWFIRAERLPLTVLPEGYLEAAPDLAVEVISPTDMEQDRREKIDDYLAAGTSLVWVAYPRSHEIVAHTPDGIALTFRVTDTLTAPDLLPGFACPVTSLFV